MMRYPGVVALPRHSALMNPFVNLRFRGTTDPRHPMRFVEIFRQIANEENLSDRDCLSFFGHCLQDEAANWWAIQRVSTFKEALFTFADRFWNRKIQSRHHRQLLLDKFSRGSKDSMADYATKRYLDAGYYSPLLMSIDIVDAIIMHFPARVVADLESKPIGSMNDLARHLDSLETRYKETRIDPYAMGDSQFANPASAVAATDHTTATKALAPTNGASAKVPFKKRNWTKKSEDQTAERPISREPSPAPLEKRGRHTDREIQKPARKRSPSTADMHEVASFYMVQFPDKSKPARVVIPTGADESGRPYVELALCHPSATQEMTAMVDSGPPYR